MTDRLAALGESLKGFDDHARLVLIDWIADSLSDDYLRDEIDLTAAFRLCAEYDGWPETDYPGGDINPGSWTRWREKRDRALEYHLGYPERIRAMNAPVKAAVVAA